MATTRDDSEVVDARPDRATEDSTSAAGDSGTRIWLYDVDGEDAPIHVNPGEIPEPTDKQMLWVDVDLAVVDELAKLWDRLGIADRIADIDNSRERPQLHQHEGVTQLNIFALRVEPAFKTMALHCLVGTNWIVTLHEDEVNLVDEFNKPFHGETRLGALDGPSFLAMVLDWQLNGYFQAIDALQAEVDHLDEDLLQDAPDEDALLQQLLTLRRRVRKLRQTLAPHREILGLLSNPDSDLVVGVDSSHHYERVSKRLERALDGVDTTREMIVGSFDIFMTRTAQATNEIMKRLTLVSVLLLPAAAIAGIMGMNFKVPMFEWPWMFWAVVGLMVSLATATLVTAKRRGWI